MAHLPHTATDEDFIRFVDHWAALMEAENYVAAYAYTGHDEFMKWTPDLMREVIKLYDESKVDQTVTLEGTATDVQQRKDIRRWPKNRNGSSGEIWYDLNIDGAVSDLTATFSIQEAEDGLAIQFSDIHVM